MFCENCGKEIPDKALFCVGCGARIEKRPQGAAGVHSQQMKQSGQVWQPEQMQRAQQIPKAQQIQQPYSGNVNVAQKQESRKPIPMITKILFCEIIVFVICAVILYGKVKEYTSPEMTAKAYFTAVMAGNSENAYKMIDVEENEFINKDTFKKLTEQIGCKNIKNYMIKENKGDYFEADEEGEEDSPSKEVIITYRLKEDTSDYNFVVKLDKSDTKKYFLFDDWKVNVGDYIQKDIVLEVAGSSKVQIDGKELNEKYKKKSEDNFGFQIYTIPKMFEGVYDIKITSDIYSDYSDRLSVLGGENYFSAEDVSLKEEVINQVMEQAKTDFKQLWNDIVEKKNLVDVTNVKMSDNKSEIEEGYMSLVEDFKRQDGTGKKKIKFDNFEISAEAGTESYNSNIPVIYVYFTAPYTCTYVEQNWWDGTFYDEDNTGTYNATLGYQYMNGEWVLTSADIDNIY